MKLNKFSRPMETKFYWLRYKERGHKKKKKGEGFKI